jgi:hypothetical protein
MKTIIIATLLIMLTGCAIPVERTFPDAPDELKINCADLILIKPTTKLSDVILVVTDNYSQYQECQSKVDSWIDWYNKQKDIFNSVK